MRMLLGALALAASIVHADSRAGQVQTLYTSPAHQTIAAFAQDDGLVAWFAPGKSPACNAVWVWQLGGAKQHLPAQGGSYHNVTCNWQIPPGSPVGLAVAGNNGSPALLWTLRESAAQSLRFDYVLGATVGDPNERRFQEVTHANHGDGLWLSGLAGSGSTLLYSVTQVEYKDQVACLSTPKQPGACALKITGGGVYRVVGRKPPTLIKGAPASVAIAVSGSDVACVPAVGTSATDGHPIAAADNPIEIRDVASGSLVTSITPSGAPLAIALSDTTLAVLDKPSTGTGLELSWYDLNAGTELGSVTVPAQTTASLALADGAVVFRVGNSIRTVDLTSQAVKTIATATATPIGLSASGSRVAWAENVNGRGRIRAVTLTP